METYLVEKTDNSVTIGFRDANLTIITPMMKALEQDANVDLVRYIDSHPELEDRKLYVRVNNGDALDAVKKASDSVIEYYSSIKE